MTKTIALLIATVLCAKVMASPYSDARDTWLDEMTLFGGEKWGACAADAIGKDYAASGQEYAPSMYYGAAGDGARRIGMAACGNPRADDKIEVPDHCAFEPNMDKHALATQRGGYLYASKTKRAEYQKACKALYNSKKGEAIRAAEAKGGQKRNASKDSEAKARRAQPWSVDRAADSAGGAYAEIIIRTDKTRMIKCALLDASGDYVAVDEGLITAPVDSLLIHKRGASWTKVECFDSK